MLKDDILDELVRITLWAPIIDICCSIEGLNALAPLFYDASSDATEQIDVLQGKDLLCNPPFDRIGDFIGLVQRAYA